MDAPKLSPQQQQILERLRAVPGSDIRTLHADLNIPYECVRTVVHRLLKLQLIEKPGKRPLYLSGLYPVPSEQHGPAA